MSRGTSALPFSSVCVSTVLWNPTPTPGYPGTSTRAKLSCSLPDAHRIVRAVGIYRADIEDVDARVCDPEMPEVLREIRIAREPLLAVRRQRLVLPDAPIVPRRAFGAQRKAVPQGEVLRTEHQQPSGADIVAAARRNRRLAEHLAEETRAESQSPSAQAARRFRLPLQRKRVADAVAIKARTEPVAVVRAVDSKIPAHRAGLRAPVAQAFL